MDDQTIINWALAGFGALFGFFGKSLWEADKALSEKMNAIEVLVAGKYVTRDELTNIFDKVTKQLDRIEDKLEGKADK